VYDASELRALDAELAQREQIPDFYALLDEMRREVETILAAQGLPVDEESLRAPFWTMPGRDPLDGCTPTARMARDALIEILAVRRAAAQAAGISSSRVGAEILPHRILQLGYRWGVLYAQAVHNVAQGERDDAAKRARKARAKARKDALLIVAEVLPGAHRTLSAREWKRVRDAYREAHPEDDCTDRTLRRAGLDAKLIKPPPTPSR
jgi:hypothetical protein